MLRPLCAGIGALLCATSASAQSYAIQTDRLIVDAAQPARGPSTVIVDKGRIIRIETGKVAPEGMTVVDLSGKTVMPGLIDTHVHLTVDATIPRGQSLTTKYSEPYYATMGLKNALTTARAGFTTIRDLGGPMDASIAVRNALREGSFPGPRLMIAGEALSIVGGHGDHSIGFAPHIGAAIRAATPQIGVCTGAEECARSVRTIAARGANVIKVMATGGVLDDGAIGLGQHFADAELVSIVETAHSLGLKVAAHAHGAGGIGAAARAGVDSIEHGTFADVNDLAAMKARGTYMVPTLMASQGLTRFMGKGIYGPNTEIKARAALVEWGKALNRAYKAGVKIAFGTDAAVFPHGQNAQEMALMVEKGGMSPRDALIAATSSAAALLGLSETAGTLEQGKSADIIAVDGDPLTDPSAVMRVRYVMVEGREVPMN